ncbi:MAG: Bifunctional phosphoglucose/phosphomannose isomerase [Berkelbacteria bacterium GW2011_GWA2_35_9]|uniref:Bifunctional phosphoglucose/phosphomannose isomerase n=1 Tax=Berkelbacteria bacterium GW2011_GWA2_35_9 TaxID=1618333 RepID=A0A0G0DK75_9BACT|nr:MAG: Bifunctional phosphoglucose/phosphomannose isomerase [Berkelbacteria bacterium GW2011_GWA2_35_9]
MSIDKEGMVSSIKKLDTQNMISSIEEMPLQVQEAWGQAQNIKLDYRAKNIKNILVAGMGGSALGARIIKALFQKELKVPIDIYNDYSIPAFVNKDTLFIASSYSGDTEETLDALEKAIIKTKMIISIGSGGKLIERSKELNIPFYHIKPSHNPCNQPRMAVAYSIIGQLAFFDKIGLISLSNDWNNNIIKLLESNNNNYSLKINPNHNLTQELAAKIYGKIPVIVSSEHLVGAIYTSRNQFNENSKNYADYHIIPELNHHILESLSFPKSNSKNLVIVIINSKFFDKRNQKRLKITSEIAIKNKIEVEYVNLFGETKVEEVFESIHFFAYVIYYLAMLNGCDPSFIPWVDLFKKKMKK